ncbi:hypothetical protein L9F63_002122, partial [Diploptera punctata]
KILNTLHDYLNSSTPVSECFFFTPAVDDPYKIAQIKDYILNTFRDSRDRGLTVHYWHNKRLCVIMLISEERYVRVFQMCMGDRFLHRLMLLARFPGVFTFDGTC